MAQVTWSIWPPCPYMEKIFKKSSLKPNSRWPWKLVCRIRYKVCSNDDSGLALTFFMARSNLVPYSSVWEKGKIMGFSETIVVFGIKVGWFSQLNEYMNLYGYQRSRLLIDLRQRLLDSTFSNFFCSETARPIATKFCMEPPYDVGNENLFKCSRSHDSGHIWWKTSKIFFFGTERQMILKLGI